MNRAVAVIPARYASSRFPGKPLVPLGGKPMVQRVYEAAARSRRLAAVVVATDDARIAAAVSRFGGRVVMTSSAHRSGTDRVAEAAAGLDAEVVVNIQGDEPLMPTAVIDALVQTMDDVDVSMATVAVPFSRTRRQPADPNAVKVVVDSAGDALYFSRAPIPFCRSGGTPVEPLLHWGVYAYRHAFLRRFVGWQPGRLEVCEMLEQLRALENGARIRVIQADVESIGVDVPADVEVVEKLLAERGEL